MSTNQVSHTIGFTKNKSRGSWGPHLGHQSLLCLLQVKHGGMECSIFMPMAGFRKNDILFVVFGKVLWPAHFAQTCSDTKLNELDQNENFTNCMPHTHIHTQHHYKNQRILPKLKSTQMQGINDENEKIVQAASPCEGKIV